MRLLPILLLLLASLAAPLAFALPDELEVRLDETNKQGQFAFDVISNYTVAGPRKPPDEELRSGVHLLQVSPAISYGLTAHTQIGVQLFSSVGLHGDARVDGGRFEVLSVPIRPDDDDDDGFFLGGLLELGHLPRTLSENNIDAELKMIIGYRIGRWTFASNPEIDFKVAGNGFTQPELAAKFKLAYRLDQRYSVGLEHYGDIGRLHHIGPLSEQSQQTFAVLDYKGKEMELNLGIGRGWNDFSERWVLKTAVSFPFGK